jgi:hypothetical protein
LKSASKRRSRVEKSLLESKSSKFNEPVPF